MDNPFQVYWVGVILTVLIGVVAVRWHNRRNPEDPVPGSDVIIFLVALLWPAVLFLMLVVGVVTSIILFIGWLIRAGKGD